MLEETGMKVRAEQLTGVYKNIRLGVVSLAFRCRVVGGETHESDEARKVAWLTAEEATRQMPEARGRCRARRPTPGGCPRFPWAGGCSP